MTTQIRNQPQVDLLQSDFVSHTNMQYQLGDAVSRFQALPGLVGFWPMSSVQRSTGNAYDLSDQGRTLTYNGNPTYNIYNNFVPYIDLDGTGDYLSRADETDLDILGTETIYNAGVRGLTFGGWFWADGVAAANQGLIGKYNATTGNASYLLRFATNNARAILSNTGAYIAGLDLGSTVPILASTWYFIVERFIPSTELAISVNGVWTRDTTGIPANIFNGNAPLDIGGYEGANLLDGRATLCFLCANSLDDSLIGSLFQQTRVLFGV